MSNETNGPRGVLASIKAVCGSAHLWVIFINLITAAAIAGLFWGSMTKEMEFLKREVESNREIQNQWNVAEQRIDENHRDRMSQIQDQMFRVLLMMEQRK